MAGCACWMSRPDVTVEEIRAKTEAAFTVSPDLKVAA